MASEESYIHILSRLKLMPKLSILASFWKPKAGGQTVLPDRSVLIGQIGGKCQNWNATFWVFLWLSLLKH